MNNISYSVKMVENGSLAINLPIDYVSNPSDKYFSLLYTKYFLEGVYNDYVKNDNRNLEFSEGLGNTLNYIDGLSFELEKILKKIYRENAESYKQKHNDYQLLVESIEDFQKIIEKNIDGEIYVNEMIFNLENGLTVLVKNENIRYSYFDGEIIKIDDETE